MVRRRKMRLSREVVSKEDRLRAKTRLKLKLVMAIWSGEKSRLKAKSKKMRRKKRGEVIPPVEKMRRRVMVMRMMVDSMSMSLCLREAKSFEVK